LLSVFPKQSCFDHRNIQSVDPSQFVAFLLTFTSCDKMASSFTISKNFPSI
jgi:hypothetical protein